VTPIALGPFFEDVASNFLAGLALAVLAAVTIEIYLFNKRRREETQVLAQGALTYIRAELEWNQRQAEEILHLDRRATPPAVLYSCNGWDLIRQSSVISVLETDTASEVTLLYGNLRLTNSSHDLVAAHFFGSAPSIVQQLIAIRCFSEGADDTVARSLTEEYEDWGERNLGTIKQEIMGQTASISRALALIEWESERPRSGWAAFKSRLRLDVGGFGGRLNRSRGQVRVSAKKDWDRFPKELRTLFYSDDASVDYHGPRIGFEKLDRHTARRSSLASASLGLRRGIRTRTRWRRRSGGRSIPRAPSARYAGSIGRPPTRSHRISMCLCDRRQPSLRATTRSLCTSGG